MPVFNNALAGAAGSAGGAGGFKIERSVRLAKDDDAHFSKTFVSSGNRLKWTWAGWVKRTKLSNTAESLMSCYVSGVNNDAGYFNLHFNGSNMLDMGGWYTNYFRTNRLFRDPTAWMHICVAYDRSLAASNRIKVFVNGVRETSFDNYNASASAFYPFNSANLHNVGGNAYYTNNDGKLGAGLAEVHFLDGLTPGTSTDNANGSVTGTSNAEYLTDFGEFDADTGVWNPIEYTGEYRSPVNQNQTWSSFGGSGVYSANYAWTKLFDSDPDSKTVPANNNSITADFSSLSGGGIAYTSSLEVHYNRNTNAPDVTVNGSGISAPNDGAYNVYKVTGSGTLTSVGTEQRTTLGSGDCSLFKIVIDGEELVDSGVTPISTGFHLDFSDNSSKDALGTDSSGNNNTWTVNNLATTSFDALGNVSHVGPGNLTSIATGTYYNLVHVDSDGVSSDPVSGALFRFNFSALGLTAPATITFDSYEQGGGGWTTVSTNVYTDAGTVTSTTSSNGNTRSNTVNIPSGATYLELPGSYNSQYSLYSNGMNNLVWGGTSYQHIGPEEIDSLLDSPTNYEASSGNNGGNYCTLNPLSHSEGTFTQGNLRYTGPGSWRHALGTMAFTSGKWYYEVTLANGPYGQGEGNDHNGFGWGEYKSNGSTGPVATATAVFLQETGWYKNFTGSRTNTSQTMAAGDVLSVAVDLDANTFEFRRNGTSIATGTIGGTPGRELTPFVISYNGDYGLIDINFGQRPFVYPPGGTGGPAATYKSLCTTNLDDPLIADGSDYFDIKLYTGNGATSVNGSGSTQTISGYGFAPGFLWIKDRSAASDHNLANTIVGAPNLLFSNKTDAEDTTSTDGLTGFTSDGFTLGDNNIVTGNQTLEINKGGNSYVAWAWASASSTSSNTDGSITSSVRANQTAGFSVVTGTQDANNTLNTFGHGLNAEPHMVILKRRNGAEDWYVYLKALGNTSRIQLNSTSAVTTGSGVWGSTTPTSSVFTIQSFNAGNFVAYCFAPVEGYSSFGSYTGNGSTNGPFVYTGFRPKFILVKDTSDSNNWGIIDTERDAFNASGSWLNPNDSSAEIDFTSSYPNDILSNGFKIRNNGGLINTNGNTYVYAAFAENPFKISRAR